MVRNCSTSRPVTGSWLFRSALLRTVRPLNLMRSFHCLPPVLGEQAPPAGNTWCPPDGRFLMNTVLEERISPISVILQLEGQTLSRKHRGLLRRGSRGLHRARRLVPYNLRNLPPH